MTRLLPSGPLRPCRPRLFEGPLVSDRLPQQPCPAWKQPHSREGGVAEPRLLPRQRAARRGSAPWRPRGRRAWTAPTDLLRFKAEKLRPQKVVAYVACPSQPLSRLWKHLTVGRNRGPDRNSETFYGRGCCAGSGGLLSRQRLLEAVSQCSSRVERYTPFDPPILFLRRYR